MTSGRVHALSFLDDETSLEMAPDELCAALGSALGLDQPAPLAVMRRALIDKQFCYYLANSAGNVKLLTVLFADPRNEKYAETAQPSEPRAEQPHTRHQPVTAPSNLTLALKAGRAITKWGAAGFGRVSAETFEARFGACQRCEYLVEPPERAIYKVKLRRENDPRVCSACGCVASRKAWLPTENCPVADPADPTVSKWGEPLSADSEKGKPSSADVGLA